LYRNGEATGQTLTLSASNEWQGTFHDLALINPADSTEYVYTVKEVGEANGLIQFGERQFDVIYGGLMGGVTSITNKEKTQEPKTRDLHVTKAWELQGNELLVPQIEVELYRNGEATGQTLTLSASNDWQGTFRDLALINPANSTEYVYTVKEVGEANGLIQFGERQFDVTYTGTMIDGFTIENKEKPTTPPDIPEEPGEPEEPPTPPEIPEEPGEPEKPSAPENPRKQLPPTGEVMSGYVLVGLLLIMNAIIVFTLIDFNEDY
ncbi:Cna B-type domain-containing protein, partial [Falseniella ignava]